MGAPCMSKTSRISSCPPAAAKCNGVEPCSFNANRAFALSPFFIINFTTETLLLAQAMCSGVALQERRHGEKHTRNSEMTGLGKIARPHKRWKGLFADGR